MSYRTYVNDEQLFGNNECYIKWITYIQSKGIEVDEDGCYEGELDNFMEALDVIESIVIELEEDALAHRNTSIFDLSSIYKEATDQKYPISILDNELRINDFYMFLPYAFYNFCKDSLEQKDTVLNQKHMNVYELKSGHKIKVSAH